MSGRGHTLLGVIIQLTILGEGPLTSTHAWKCVGGSRISSTLTYPSKTNFLCDFSSLVMFLTSAYSLQAVLNHDLSKPHRRTCISLWNGIMCYLLDQKAHISISFHLPARSYSA